ncbi:MAG: sugar transferase [Spirochaetes bacterium]|nr:sugar transferase [Spirochaetota bacterium]
MIIKIIYLFIDIVLVSGAEMLAFMTRLGYPLQEIYLRDYQANLVFIIIIRVWALYSARVYSDKIKSYMVISNAVLKATILSTVIIAAVTFFNRTLSYPRSVIVISFAYTLVLLWIKYFFYWKYYIIKKEKRRVLIIGATEAGKNVVKGSFSAKHWEIVGFLDDKLKKGRKVIHQLKVLGKIGDLGSLYEKHRINLIVLAIPDEKMEFKLKVMAQCEEYGLSYIIVPSFYEILTGRAKLDDIEDMAVLEPAPPSFNLFNRIFKRLFDIIVSSVILILSSPVSLLITVLIKITSRGKIFYKQQRAGQGGKPFCVYKFRTMVEGADKKGPVITRKKDKRITSFGWFLRRFSLDEIPQFLNVLKGDMSLIGPRPEVVQIVKRYKKWQRRVLRFKPGISGLSQVSGRQDLDIDTKLRLDLYYINNYSLLLDLEIIFKTIFVVLKGEGGY